MPLDPELADLIRGIRTRLSMRTPFFGSLAMFVNVESSEKIPTAATDGQRILINPTFFIPLSSAEQDAVFLHEVLHAALLHVARGQERDAERWNIAADIVVNGILAKEDFILPENGIRNPWLERFSVEEVYDLLKQPNWSRQNFKLENHDLLTETAEPGDSSSPTGPPTGQLSQAKEKAAKDYWSNAREQAGIMAESSMYGSLPASIQRELDQLKPAQLNWREYLWRYLVRTPIDYSGFDRRFVWQKIYLESLEGETVRIAVSVDTSGSINNKQVQLFLSEVQEILRAYPHLRCDLYYADAKLYGPYELVAGTTIPPPVGGGGTDFRPFFDHLSAAHDPSTLTVSVYLTDGYGSFPKAFSTCPVLWVVTAGGRDSAQFPFGEVVRLVGES
jgi:predicted metal-dependent peptidase